MHRKHYMGIYGSAEKFYILSTEAHFQKRDSWVGWKLPLLSRWEEENRGRKAPFGVAGISVGFSTMAARYQSIWVDCWLLQGRQNCPTH